MESEWRPALSLFPREPLTEPRHSGAGVCSPASVTDEHLTGRGRRPVSRNSVCLSSVPNKSHQLRVLQNLPSAYKAPAFAWSAPSEPWPASKMLCSGRGMGKKSRERSPLLQF